MGFHIEEGETYGLLGPNGAGKTTTISMIAGLLERDRGEVFVDCRPFTTRSVRTKEAIGYVPQELAVYPRAGDRRPSPRTGRPGRVRGGAAVGGDLAPPPGDHGMRSFSGTARLQSRPDPVGLG